MHHKFTQKVSLFNSTFDKNPRIIELGIIFEKIRTSSQLKHLCGLLQTIDDKNEKQPFKKKNLPAITVSGTFSNGHGRRNLLKHSGLIQIDLDGKDFPPLVDLKKVVKLLKNDLYTFLGFISPSGTGYKLVVKIQPDPTKHLASFKALEKYYLEKYNLIVDQNCKDLGRLCFLSYDPFVYINWHAKEFLPIDDSAIYLGKPIVEIDHGKLEIEVIGIVKQIEKLKIDITNNYRKEWLKLAFALSVGLGEKGRQYFHRISIFSNKYNREVADKQYTECLKGRNSGITIKSFFGLAKYYGININPLQLHKITNHEG